jgi:hypothetical protein
MPWLNCGTIAHQTKGGRQIVNIGIPHESECRFVDHIIDIPTLKRPLFELESVHSDTLDNNVDILSFIEYNEGNDVPVFGSFGFGFDNKGFHKVVEKVNLEYDRAIIKLVISGAHFDPQSQSTSALAKLKCESANVKPGIKLMITHEFLSNSQVLAFLSKNTMNVFLYDSMHGRGISSAVDYALSVKRPIGISDSYMFRHLLAYRDTICLHNTSLAACMTDSANIGVVMDVKMNNGELRLQIEREIDSAMKRPL